MFSEGERLQPAKQTDLEVRLDVRRTSLRTIDSKLGSKAGGSAGEACVAVASLAVYRAQEESSLDAVCLTLEKQECGTERYSVILLVQKHLKSLGLGLCGLSWLAVHLSQISSCHHTN